MEKYKLSAKARTQTGRKVKQLRKAGILPANVYGKKIKSLAVEIALKDFLHTYKKAGETHIIDLTIGGSQVRPVLIHNVQKNTLSGSPIHADLYQVDLKAKIKTRVPVVLEGKSPVIEQKAGLLLQTVNDIEIEALPTSLPESLKLNIESLTQVGQELKVKDIKTPPGVTLLTSPMLGVVKVAQLVSKEAEQLVQEEQAAAQAAKATTQTETEQAATPTGESQVPPEAVPSSPNNPEAATKLTDQPKK